MKVTLIAWNTPEGADPRRLVLLAVKTSQGRLSFKGLDYYLRDYPEEDVRNWLIDAVRFPSVLEHIVFTFLIEDISRVTSHQLVRHRIASYTQESQRYSETKPEYVIPETVKVKGFEERFKSLVEELFRFYKEMVDSGVPYEDARYILPQAVTTKILMTVNLRELIHIACLRLSEKAQWEIRELASKMVEEASKVVPELPNMIRLACSSLQV